MRLTGPLESVALLTVLPVPRRARTSTRGVLPWAPVVGLLLGGIAGGVAVLGAEGATPLVGAVLAIAALAVLTRGLHLDGLADTADGLGPLRAGERALRVMRQGDVGPFGVAALVLTLLLQVACLDALLRAGVGWPELTTAAVVARLAMARTGLPRVPMAAGSSLGRSVSGTVSPSWFAICAGVVIAVLAAVAAFGDPTAATRLALAAAVGLLAAELVHRSACVRLGGVTGDVMGAMGETTTAAFLLTAAIVV